MKEKIEIEKEKDASIPKKEICISIDYSKPVLDVLADTIDDFLVKLLDGCPKTYFVKIEIGNDHPQVVTFPICKCFRGDGDPLEID